MDSQYDSYDYEYDDLEHAEGTPIGPLLLVVFTSILEVFLLCLAGYILAGRGILDKKTQKQLNRLNVSLFTPALLFSKVAFFLTPEKLRELWIIPIFFVVVTGVSMSVAFVLGWMSGLKKSQRSFAMAAAMFMNSNSLPIALMQSLVVTVPGLKWDMYDSKNAMLGRALTYLVMYSTLGMVLRWSYGVKLLTQADTEVIDVPPASQIIIDERSPLLSSYDHAEYYTHQPNSASTIVGSESEFDCDPTNAKLAVVSQQPQPKYFPRPPPKRRTTFYNSFPNSPNQSRVDLAGYDSASSSLGSEDGSSGEDGGDQATLRAPTQRHAHTLPTHHAPPTPLPLTHRLSRRLHKSWAALNDFMTVPLWAALASLIVACIAPLQRALENDMQPIKGAITSAGKCSIPLTLIVLGAYFRPEPREGERVRSIWENLRSGWEGVFGTCLKGKGKAGYLRLDEEEEREAERRAEDAPREGETKTVWIAVLARMVITPILLMPMMVLAARYDWLPVFEDPVFMVANVLLIASPPALTLAQITQAASGDAFERLISRTIFWSYCVVTPPTTIIYVVVGLMVAKI